MWQLELPILKAHGDYNKENQKLGLGDIRLRSFYIMDKTEDPDSIYQVFAVSLDTYLPTGSVNNALGNGMYKFVPSVAGAFKFNENFSIYPIFGYGFTANGKLNSSDYEKNKSKGFYSEIIMSYKVTEKLYFLMTPLYAGNENSSTNGGKRDNFAVKFDLGYMLTDYSSVGIWANIPLNNKPYSDLRKADYMYNQETLKLYYYIAF